MCAVRAGRGFGCVGVALLLAGPGTQTALCDGRRLLADVDSHDPETFGSQVTEMLHPATSAGLPRSRHSPLADVRRWLQVGGDPRDIRLAGQFLQEATCCRKATSIRAGKQSGGWDGRRRALGSAGDRKGPAGRALLDGLRRPLGARPVRTGWVGRAGWAGRAGWRRGRGGMSEPGAMTKLTRSDRGYTTSIGSVPDSCRIVRAVGNV